MVQPSWHHWSKTSNVPQGIVIPKGFVNNWSLIRIPLESAVTNARLPLLIFICSFMQISLTNLLCKICLVIIM